MSGADRPRVMAVVVTYFPGPYLARHLDALRGQVDELVVVDNGSPDYGEIERVVLAAGCRMIRNHDNLGIAAALNQAARLAQAEGYDWLATFDQDSLAPAGAIAGLLALHAAHPDRERIGMLAMSHRDRNTGAHYRSRFEILDETPTWRRVRTVITSGALARVEAFGTVGLFDEALFIDSVDHDFCLRCRRLGLMLIESKSQVLEHALGEGAVRRFLWWRVTVTGHSPSRRYYITRNTLEMCRRYLFTDLTWVALSAHVVITGSVAALALEDQRRAKAFAMVQGAWHFLTRRFGPRPTPGGARRS